MIDQSRFQHPTAISFKGTIESAAALSPCGVYRYALFRAWGDGRVVNWIMLNPSTADHQENDPTIRRCLRFSRGWGFDGLVVTNLFAFRSTSPKKLKSRSIAPVGALNNQIIREAIKQADLIVCAWGANGGFLERDQQVLKLLSPYPNMTKCLGVTDKRFPRHPLMLKANTQLEQYPE